MKKLKRIPPIAPVKAIAPIEPIERTGSGHRVLPPDETSEQQNVGEAAGGTREQIRAITHRVMGSRQSKRPPERHDQHRQPKTGGTGGHGRRSNAIPPPPPPSRASATFKKRGR